MNKSSFSNDKPLNYEAAGVNIKEANQLTKQIKSIAEKTQNPAVLNGIGGFGALYALSKDYKEPVLVSGTDGVGTKLKIAITLNRHETIGIDLVAMCVNDIITLGAKPLFFLDYFATSKLNADHAQAVIKGISEGCLLAGAALIGGETAEMPGMYANSDYDLAGFCVGVVEKENIIDKQNVQPGDVLIALPASGPHANGYSLIRKIIERAKIDLSTPFSDTTLGEALLTPTRIYANAITTLCQQINVHAIAHITGGGLYENLPRVLPDHTCAVIDAESWSWPDIFQWLQDHGNVSMDDMYHTFNVGVGMIICVDKNDVKTALNHLNNQNESPWVIGKIHERTKETPAIIID